MNRGRALIVATLAGGLVLSITPTALAADTVLKSGSQTCGVGKIPVSYTEGRGHYFLRGPGKSGRVYYNVGGSYNVRQAETGPGGSWDAGLWGTGTLDTSATGSYCSASPA